MRDRYPTQLNTRPACNLSYEEATPDMLRSNHIISITVGTMHDRPIIRIVRYDSNLFTRAEHAVC